MRYPRALKYGVRLFHPFYVDDLLMLAAYIRRACARATGGCQIFIFTNVTLILNYGAALAA